MTHRLDVARGRDVVARWCALAEQRLEYLTELFETGRWRRYHSERRISGKYPGSQGRGRNLARSVDARGVAGQFRGRHVLARSHQGAGAQRRWAARSGSPAPMPQPAHDCRAEAPPSSVSIVPEAESWSVRRSAFRAVRLDEAPSRADDARSGRRISPRHTATLSAAAQRAVGRGLEDVIQRYRPRWCDALYLRTALVPITTWAKRCAPSADRSGVTGRA